jgi:hypothetical protein
MIVFRPAEAIAAFARVLGADSFTASEVSPQRAQ